MLHNNIREKLLKAFLDTAILASLEVTYMNGYDLTIYFIKKFGAAISTSTVYSTLYAMERNGLIKAKYNRRSRVYELTEKGKKALEDSRNNLRWIQEFINKLHM